MFARRAGESLKYALRDPTVKKNMGRAVFRPLSNGNGCVPSPYSRGASIHSPKPTEVFICPCKTLLGLFPVRDQSLVT